MMFAVRVQRLVQTGQDTWRLISYSKNFPVSVTMEEVLEWANTVTVSKNATVADLDFSIVREEDRV